MTNKKNISSVAAIGGMVLYFIYFWFFQPLPRSEFVNQIIEPITIIEGFGISDGGSQYLKFHDSEGKVFWVTLNDTINGDEHLYLKGKKVQIAGSEEKAFLELLERWNQQRSADPPLQDEEKIPYSNGNVSNQATFPNIDNMGSVNGAIGGVNSNVSKTLIENALRAKENEIRAKQHAQDGCDIAEQILYRLRNRNK